MPQPEKEVNQTMELDAPVSEVWHAITAPELLGQWLSPEGIMRVETDWSVGSDFILNGTLHGRPIRVSGKVLEFAPERSLAYTQWSYITKLKNLPENHSEIRLTLEKSGEGSSLSVRHSKLPGDSAMHHVAFYWRGALNELKKLVEHQHNDTK